MKNKFTHKVVLLTSMILGVIACTDLEEEVLDGVLINPSASSGSSASATDLLLNAKKSFYNVAQGQERFLTMGEHPTDALAGPTRGGDWDDNSKWRQMHTMTWDAVNPFVISSYNDYLTGVYNTDLVLAASPSASEENEALFYKAYFYYHILDKWGRVPYRTLGSSNLDNPEVYSGAEATALAIGWLEGMLSALPEKTSGSDPSIITSAAANFLLAKFYLNKAVFDSAEKSESYTFDAADMNKVIVHAEAVIGSSPLQTTSGSSIADHAYWSLFGSDNAEVADELVLTCKNQRGIGFQGNVQYAWRASTHYNQAPIGGWNGWAVPGEFYDTFDASDERRQYSNDSIISRLGNPIGLMIGQVYEPGGVEKVLDRNGKDLVFSKELPLVTTGDAIESAGVRPVKYIPDFENYGDAENDGIVFRSADAYLMIAEAILRGGSAVSMSAQEALDAVRMRAGLASQPASLDLVYDERGRELWFEGWRREDMIRWGTLLSPRQLKPGQTDAAYLLYPFPADALLNPNITQNPGY